VNVSRSIQGDTHCVESRHGEGQRGEQARRGAAAPAAAAAAAAALQAASETTKNRRDHDGIRDDLFKEERNYWQRQVERV